MHPHTKKVARHLRNFGMAVLGRAAYDVTFSEMQRPYAHLMAVNTAAQGAELVIKGRIAQEHPLLLFNTLPKSKHAEDQLTIKELYEYGRTIQYHELPEVLWAATGFRMDRVEQFQEFGRVRNASVHFAVPDDEDPQGLVIQFLFEVMEPLVYQFWFDSIVPYAAEWDEYVWEDDGLRGQLEQNGIEVTPYFEAALERETWFERNGRRKEPRPIIEQGV